MPVNVYLPQPKIQQCAHDSQHSLCHPAVTTTDRAKSRRIPVNKSSAGTPELMVTCNRRAPSGV